MGWTKPQYTRGAVNAAGESLAKLADNIPDAELAVINNWRAAHSYPLQVLKMALLTRAKRIDSRALIAQRLKRLSSIAQKLRRNPAMQLARMHDIGGCRGVVRTVAALDRLVSTYKETMAKNPSGRPECARLYDYVTEPKADGYRSVHLVFKYRTKAQRLAIYNDLRIEIQLRTRLQHTWATAVETVSTFTGQALKSNVGSDEWKRFFALVGSAIARRERRPLVPGTPTDKDELVRELKKLTQALKIFKVLKGWSATASMVHPKKDDHIFLLVLNMTQWTVNIRGFHRRNLSAASEAYLEAEKANVDNTEIQVVLVSVESIQALRSAYPNYYLDTRQFMHVVEKAIS